jgi:hypothetical protein
MTAQAQLTNTNTPIVSRRALAGLFRHQTHAVWVSCAGGSDERPYMTVYVNLRRVDTPAPVAHVIGFGDRREDEHVPAGDILRWLDEAPNGACLHIPEYSGMHYRGERCFRKAKGRWQDIGFWDEWDQLVEDCA